MPRMITDEEAVQAECQHTVPCGDCPWTRTAINGWLGNGTIDEWIALAHSDHIEGCHTLKGAQCAGLSVYRANVCKSARDPEVLKLPADRGRVFSTPMEFRDHHTLTRKT
jgi:hypothetical protein